MGELPSLGICQRHFLRVELLDDQEGAHNAAKIYANVKESHLPDVLPACVGMHESAKVEEIYPMANALCGGIRKYPNGYSANEHYLNRDILEDPQGQNTASIQAT
jgi:hypothetical protein